MSDWQVGDLALCIKSGEWRGAKTGRPSPWKRNPEYGGVYTVEDISPTGALYLIGFNEKAMDINTREVFRQRFTADRFRKIRPSAIKHIEALKRLPVEVKEDA